MITFAQQIHDRTVRHHVLLQRFSDSEVRRIMRLLSRDVFPDILAQAQAITARFEGAGFVRMAGIARRARLERMLAEMSATIRGGASVLHGAIRDPLLPFARAEAEWMLDALRRSTPIEIGFSAAEPQLLRSITTSRPMAGRNLREWSRSVGASTSRRVAQQIRIGVAQGEDTSTIVRRVRGTQANQFRDGVLQTTRREAEAVVRTAVNHTATHARQAVLENNLGAFDYVRWVSVLDARTSRICAPLDGTEWPVDKGPRPPAHSN
ncbi:MAG: phage minor head protein, partial [Mycobacterium sp.]